MPNKSVAKDPGKAVAKRNAEELKAEPTVEEKRERRGEILDELRSKDTERMKNVQADAKDAGLHEAKLDDAGAAEQQRVARDSNIDVLNELSGLEGPPVVAPVLESSPGKIKVVSRREGAELDKGVDYETVTSARFVGFNLHVIGEGFPAPGEVIIDIRRKDGQDHQRFSAWTEDGRVDAPLPGINGIGDWLLHCESLVTQVGEGRDDRLPLIKETEEVSLELY